MNPLQLTQPAYLFEATPGSDFSLMIPFLVFFLAILLASFGIENWIRKHPDRKSLEKTIPHAGSHLRTFALIGFVLLWFRHENLPYLSMRAGLLFLLIVLVAYTLWSFYQLKTQLPAIIEAEQMKKTRKQYLTKQKKRRR